MNLSIIFFCISDKVTAVIFNHCFSLFAPFLLTKFHIKWIPELLKLFFISQVFFFFFFKMFNWSNLIVVTFTLKWDSSSDCYCSILICFLGTVVFIRNDIFPFLGLKITAYIYCSLFWFFPYGWKSLHYFWDSHTFLKHFIGV